VDRLTRWIQGSLEEIQAASCLLCTADPVLTAGVCAQVSPPPSALPSDKQVLAFLTESIDWYRHRAAEEQLATEPGDLVFLEDNRPVATHILQLSFAFARAQASFARTQDLEVTSFPKPRDSGILGLSSQVARLERKLRTLDDEIRRTDKLHRSSSDVRSPLLAYANKRFPISADNNLPSSDLGLLQHQKAELDALIAVAKTLAPAIVASDKQNVLFTAYISRLKTWRAAVENDNAKTWRSLILRLVAIGAAIGALLLIGAAVRELTDRHVQAAERRHVLRVAARVAPWILIVLIVAFSFTSDLTSLATFFGLLTAGAAIALQNVIVSALAYFLLVGKGGIRVGDRVQISGITGDVTDIGWLQFQIRENDKKTQQSTGNVVTFPNSLVRSIVRWPWQVQPL
jgi:hypothetical protein